MSKTLRYRLLKVGAMPEAMSAKIANEQVLFSDEGMRVIVRRSGKAPGFRGSSVGRFSGACAITDQRIVASISKTLMVDAPYNLTGDHKSSASLAEDGLHIKVDASVNPRCEGEIDMHFKQQFSADDLNRFPHREIEFNFAPELVPKIFGVPA